jgi:hypothetical protein
MGAVGDKGKPNGVALPILRRESAGRLERILAQRQVFLARSATREFLGFADNQLKRMQGLLGRGKKGQRREIESKFGFDVKAAMHAIRLLYECLELVSEGQITLPRPERELLITIRRGDFSLQQVLNLAADLFQKCAEAEKNSALPATISRAAVSKLVADAYQKHWRKQHSAQEL